MGRGLASGTTRLEGGGIALPTRASVDRRARMGPAAAVWTALALTTLDRWLPKLPQKGFGTPLQFVPTAEPAWTP